MHFYYFPIVILAYHYRRTGFAFAALLAVSYLGLVGTFYPVDQGIVRDAVVRFFVFIGIAALVSYLAERLIVAEEATKRGAEILESTLMNANVLLMALDARGRIRIWNTAAERITGYPAAEVVGREDVWRLLYPEKEYRARITGKIRKIIGENNFFENLETTIRCRNGEQKVISWNTRMIPSPDPEGGRYIAIGTDITERRYAGDALKESEEKFRAIFDHASDGMFVVDLENRRLVSCNASCARMLGYGQEEFPGLRIADIHPPEDLPFIFSEIGKFARGDEGERSDIRFRRRDGSLFFADISAASVTIAGKKYLLLSFRDITDRKATEKAIADSEQKFRNLFDSSPDGLILADPATGRFVMANATIMKQTGYTAAELLGLSVIDLVPPEGRPRAFEEFKKQVSGETTLSSDSVIQRKDGTTYLADISSTPVIMQGKKFQLGIFRDVTEQKRAEKAVQESEEKYRNLVERANDGIAIVQDEVFRYANPGLALIWGGTVEEMTGLPFTAILPPDERERLVDRYRKRIAGEPVPPIYETALLRRDGTRFPAEINAGVITYEGRPADLIIFRDITERKAAEEALRESEEMFRNPVERSAVGVFLVQDGTVQYANPKLAEMAGYFGELMIGMPFEPMILPEDLLKVQGAMGRLARGETPAEHVEFRAREKHGAIREVEAYGSSMIYHGRPAIFGTLIDITERKRMENQITASLREKEVMLREIHHRVKNNLQIVNSLMNLQMQKVGDPATVSALTDTQARVRAMSLVHERLYKTRELSRIDLHDYITKLAEELMRSQKVAQKIELDFRIPGIFLDINQAIPVGLILNEILTNSLKYAFPDGRKGKISIYAERGSPDLVIRIGDDGVGIPAGFDWQKSNTLGMKLIHGLVSQVDGTITMEQEGGTWYEIRIPETKPAPEGEKKTE